MLEKGDKAPDFCLPDTNNNVVCLNNFKGKWVVLYFYPKDNTSGCTKEAKEFTELLPEFEALNAYILGVSKDSPKSHQKFVEKHELKVHLLSDEDHKVLEQYGAWRLKKNYGREYYGTVRSTYLIDPEGNIAHVWSKVARASGHAEKVLQTLKKLVSESK